MMITINAGAATLGTPLFGYIVDRTGSYRARLASALPARSRSACVAMAIFLKETVRTR